MSASYEVDVFVEDNNHKVSWEAIVYSSGGLYSDLAYTQIFAISKRNPRIGFPNLGLISSHEVYSSFLYNLITDPIRDRFHAI